MGSGYLDQGCHMNPSPILDRCVLDDLLDGPLDEKLGRARSSVELYGAKTGNWFALPSRWKRRKYLTS
jgi:hypothetical protein